MEGVYGSLGPLHRLSQCEQPIRPFVANDIAFQLIAISPFHFWSFGLIHNVIVEEYNFCLAIFFHFFVLGCKTNFH